MADCRPFRFGVYAGTSVTEWVEHVRCAEALGYSSIAVGEHIFADLAPISALAAAVMVSSTIRIGSLTFANDFRNPLLLAKEIASLDVLSDGRVEFGLGSGYYGADYDQTGIPFDPPGTRLDRLFEAVRLVKRAFSEETIDHEGVYYSSRGFSLLPRSVQRPWPPLLIGGGGRRVLEFAAREADIVSINVRSTPAGGFDWRSVTPEATAEKAAWVRTAAGDRLAEVEMHWLAPHFEVTDDPVEVAGGVLARWGAADTLTPEELLACPQVLIGSEDAIVEKIERNREEYGVSYVTVFGPAMEPFAPIVARLTGT